VVIDAVLGDRPAASLTADDVGALRARLVDRRPGTRNRYLVLLRRVLNHAVELGVIGRNTIASVKLEYEDNVREVVIEERDLARILEACRPALRGLVLVLYDSGMRLSEATHLRWSQIDRERMTIHVCTSETKTRRGRTVELSPRALAAIRDLDAGTSELVWPSPRCPGRPILDTTWSHWWRRDTRPLGLRGMRGERPTLHDLRRSWATLARRAGVPEGVICAALGHRTRSTIDRYAIVAPTDLDQARALIAARRARDLAELRDGERHEPQPVRAGRRATDRVVEK
jgi:integrase